MARPSPAEISGVMRASFRVCPHLSLCNFKLIHKLLVCTFSPPAHCCPIFSYLHLLYPRSLLSSILLSAPSLPPLTVVLYSPICTFSPPTHCCPVFSYMHLLSPRSLLSCILLSAPSLPPLTVVLYSPICTFSPPAHCCPIFSYLPASFPQGTRSKS